MISICCNIFYVPDDWMHGINEIIHSSLFFLTVGV